MRAWNWIFVAVGFSGTISCGGSTPQTREAAPSASAETSPVAIPPPAKTHPVPAKLQEVAAQFGITMKDDWQWTELERMRTRFDWSGRPEGRAFEARWSFWLKGEDVRTMKPFLPAAVQSAALNLTRSSACDPFEQPAELARMVGADRVITVCFEPAPYVTEEFRHGVLHGLVRGDVLVIVIVLANDRTGTVPLPDHIGGRFSP